MKKRGFMGLSWNAIIGLIITALVFYLLVYKAPDVAETFNLFGRGQQKESSLASFGTLVGHVDKVVQDPKPYAFDRTIPYFIDRKHILVGFPQGGREVQLYDECATASDSFLSKLYVTLGGKYGALVDKPLSHCGDAACLCLIKESNLQVVQCKAFPYIDDIFTLDYYVPQPEAMPFTASEAIYKNFQGGDYTKSIRGRAFLDYGKGTIYDQKYASLNLYGECDKWWDDVSFHQSNLFIEKYQDPETKKTALFIAIDTLGLKDRADRLSGKLGASLDFLKELIDQKQYESAIEKGKRFVYEREQEKDFGTAAGAYYLIAQAYKNVILSEDALQYYANNRLFTIEEATAHAKAFMIVNYAKSFKLQKPSTERLDVMAQDILEIALTNEVSQHIAGGYLPHIADLFIVVKSDKLRYNAAKYLIVYADSFADEIPQEDKKEFYDKIRATMHVYVDSEKVPEENQIEGLQLLAESYEKTAKSLDTTSELAGALRAYKMLSTLFGDEPAKTRIQELCFATDVYIKVTDVAEICAALQPEEETEGETSEDEDASQ